MKELPKYLDVAVVGAGPAGSVVASELARRGHRVGLFERDRFPRDKVCGEFLSPESMDCLRRLGCYDAFRAHQPPAIECVRLTAASGVETTLALAATARGLSRRRLDSMLFDLATRRGALAIDGIDVRRLEPVDARHIRLHLRRHVDGVEHNHRLTARLVVAAHGRRSHLDRTLQRPSFHDHSPFVAFKRHHRLLRGGTCPPLDGLVELHAFDGGYCGVSFVEDDIVNVCTMFDRRLLRSEQAASPARPFELIARQNPALARRLKTLEPCDTETLAVAPISLASREVTCDRILYVGDAAAMIAPLAGDGQAMALESGLRLARLIDHSFPAPPVGPWTSTFHRHYRRRLQLARCLQHTLIRPLPADLGLRLLRRLPRIGEALLQWTRSPAVETIGTTYRN